MNPESTTHEFYQSDPVHGPHRLHVGTRHRLHSFGKSSVEAKALVQVHDVVIDRFRNPDHALSEAPSPDFGIDPCASLQRSVPTDDEQYIDTEFLQVIHHFAGVLRTTRTPKDCPAEGVNC